MNARKQKNIDLFFKTNLKFRNSKVSAFSAPLGSLTLFQLSVGFFRIDKFRFIKFAQWSHNASFYELVR